MTVSGPGIGKPGNYLVPLGTPLPVLLKHAEAMDDPGMVILGGPMMGSTIATTDIACTKAVTDENFLANFDNLVAKLNDTGTALANAIVTVMNGQKQNPWEIDAISGATVTSEAVGNAINSSAQQLLPVINRQLPLIQAEGAQ